MTVKLAVGSTFNANGFVFRIDFISDKEVYYSRCREGSDRSELGRMSIKGFICGMRGAGVKVVSFLRHPNHSNGS